MHLTCFVHPALLWLRRTASSWGALPCHGTACSPASLTPRWPKGRSPAGSGRRSGTGIHTHCSRWRRDTSSQKKVMQLMLYFWWSQCNVSSIHCVLCVSKAWTLTLVCWRLPHPSTVALGESLCHSQPTRTQLGQKSSEKAWKTRRSFWQGWVSSATHKVNTWHTKTTTHVQLGTF